MSTLSLKEERESAGITQKQMAEALSITDFTYREIEKNPKRATAEQIEIICGMLSKNYRKIFFADGVN